MLAQAPESCNCMLVQTLEGCGRRLAASLRIRFGIHSILDIFEIIEKFPIYFHGALFIQEDKTVFAI